MSFSHRIAEIANSSTISESSLLVNQGECEHGQFRDRSLDSDAFQRRGNQNRELSQVDKAYRKLGQQLSLRAHGGFVVRKTRTCCTIGGEGSSFTTYNRSYRRTNRAGFGSVGMNPKSIVTKTTIQSNENYQRTQVRKRNVLRHFMMNASRILRMRQEDMITEYESSRPAHSQLEDILPSSQLQTDENTPSYGRQENDANKQPVDEFVGTNRKSLPPKAPADTPRSFDTAWNRSQQSQSRISHTNSQIFRGNCNGQNKPGKCLTDPFISTFNNGFDNANGDLIVYENDVITVPRNKIHVLTKERMRDVTHVDYRVQRRLGQGTFAQVFQCCHLQTGKLVALKIVKNKSAYARQAAVEIDVLRVLRAKGGNNPNNLTIRQSTVGKSFAEDHIGTMSEPDNHDCVVDLVCYFLYKSHLCLVFELLGQNLYDVLKERNFRGLRLSVVRSLIHQAISGVAELAKNGVVHCDIKPENVLIVNNDDRSQLASQQRSDNRQGCSSSFSQGPSLIGTQPNAQIPISGTVGNQPEESKNIETNPQYDCQIKLIDFGSACFEGQAMQTYIQSRFYRSPEVLIGLPFDSAIDIWSLGCIAAELFLGLPILPGVHEHDQLGRIMEMISPLPDWMLDRGSKAQKFFDPIAPGSGKIGTSEAESPSSLSNMKWRLKSQTEFISSLSEDEIRRKGGLLKLEKQRHSRYFKKKRLAEIVLHKGQSGTLKEEKYDLDLFIHFLHGLLDPDPRKRWTAPQALQHPFLTGARIRGHTERTLFECHKSGNLANLIGKLYWEPPVNDEPTSYTYSKSQSFQQHMGSTLGHGGNGFHPSEQCQW